MPKLYKDRIEKPWTFKLEFSYGCNLSCHFCPIDTLKSINQNKSFLTLDTCRLACTQAAEIREDFRVELTLRGEPTLNPQLVENLEVIRECGPLFQITLFTNGVRIMKDASLIDKILDAGVNILCIDCYNNTYDRFFEIANRSGEQVVDFRDFSAYKRHKDGHRLRVVNLVPDIQEGAVDVRKIHNNAGNVNEEYLHSLPNYPDKVLPLGKRCARPFRELVVYHTGDVIICCHDWQAENVLGNIYEESLYNIWYGEKHWQILKSLYAKDRGLNPCRKCDYSGGYRLGLLKDPNP